DCCCLQVQQDPGHPGSVEVSGPHAPWPTRSPASASPTTLLGSSQGWLPARGGSPWAGRGSHPLEDERRFLKLSHLHSPSTHIAWSHYFSYTRPPAFLVSHPGTHQGEKTPAAHHQRPGKYRNPSDQSDGRINVHATRCLPPL